MKKFSFYQYVMIASLLFTCVTTSRAQVLDVKNDDASGEVLKAKEVIVDERPQEDAYREALKEYLGAKSYDLSENVDVKKVVAGINKKVLFDYAPDQLDALLKKYQDTQLFDDWLNCLMIPSYNGSVSIEDLKELTALFQTPEGRTYIEHETAFKKRIRQSDGMIQSSMDNAFKALRRGDRLEDVKRDKGIPKKYAKKFYESVDTSVISSLMTPLHRLLLKEAGAEVNPHLAAVLEHQRKNMSTILLNCSYGVLTEDDLDFEKQLNNMDAHKHTITAAKNMIANATQYTDAWMLAYANWLFEQPEVCDYILQKGADKANVESVSEDRKMTVKLEPGAYVMEFEIDDVEAYNELKEELQKKDDDIREIVLKEKEFLQILVHSKRRFSMNFIAKSNGLISSMTETWIDNNELSQMLDNFDALKAGVRGKKLWEKGQYEMAFPLLKQAAEADDVSAQLKVAVMLQFGKGVEKDDDEAAKWYDRVANQDDNLYYKAEALNQLAYYYAGQKQYDKALETIDKAIKVKPEEPNYYDSKGEILFMKGDKKGAKGMWQKVISLDPDFANTHNSDLYRLLYGKKK